MVETFDYAFIVQLSYTSLEGSYSVNYLIYVCTIFLDYYKLIKEVISMLK